MKIVKLIEKIGMVEGLEGQDLSGQDWSGADLTDTYLDGTNFTKAKLRNANLSDFLS